MSEPYGGVRKAPFGTSAASTAGLKLRCRVPSEPTTEVVALIVIEDLSVEEAATVLGCGVETVRTHYRRARLALVDALDDAIAVFETEGGSDAAG